MLIISKFKEPNKVQNIFLLLEIYIGIYDRLRNLNSVGSTFPFTRRLRIPFCPLCSHPSAICCIGPDASHPSAARAPSHSTTRPDRHESWRHPKASAIHFSAYTISRIEYFQWQLPALSRYPHFLEFGKKKKKST